MSNPILQMMMNSGATNNPLHMLATIKQMMNGRSPESFMQGTMQSNPQFASFVNANKNKSPEQICRENGLNWDDIKWLLK